MANQTQIQREQIFVVKTNKNVFEALDALNAENEKFNKIQLNLVDYAKTPSVFVSHSINPDVLKVLATDILQGTFTDYAEYKGSAQSKRPDGKPEARVLKIMKRSGKPGEKINYPFAITISVGEGQVIRQGAVKMVKQEQSVNMLLSEMDMKRFAITALDYIRNFEAYHQFQKIREKGAKAGQKGA
ncbi:hypothetical protein JK635_07380 [Neobacillus sp. YIM B02564]|uniref:Uncharacterized protein n=1 Tax=Neobacillus paridis TaxID=2803862 RepID=A0ABS1TL54_9BACI|nr:hypothetical protein [Neobacillus paridis]MBL4952030.1 hypothetical protein [Neobacillus paridis]